MATKQNNNSRQAPALELDDPTGIAPWPMILLAGPEKSGKSWAAAVASSAPEIGQTIWIPFGEQRPDEYAKIPGTRFKIAKHDGTYRGLLRTVEAAVALPPTDGKPNLIVLDGAGRVWMALSDMAQEEANQQYIARLRKRNQPVPVPFDEEVDITSNLWNVANSRWAHIVAALKRHQGPVILTARMEKAVIFQNGQPTNQYEESIKAQKLLPSDVDAIVEVRPIGKGTLTGYRSVALSTAKDKIDLGNNWTVRDVWDRLGVLAQPSMGVRSPAAATGAENVAAETAERARIAKAREAILARIGTAAKARGISTGTVADRWAAEHNGELIGETDELGDLLALEKRLLDVATPAADREAAQTTAAVAMATAPAGGEQTS